MTYAERHLRGLDTKTTDEINAERERKRRGGAWDSRKLLEDMKRDRQVRDLWNDEEEAQ